MAILLGVLLVISMCLSVQSAQSSATTRPSEVAALQGLLRAWNKPTNLLETWSLEEDADPCRSRWKGVHCCRSSSSKFSSIVTGLNLSNLSLVGIIPPEIGNLRNLRSLDLSRNSMLTGTIPRPIGSLHQLIKLDLSGCDLSGDTSFLLTSLKNLNSVNFSNNPKLLNSLQSLTGGTKTSSEPYRHFGLTSRRLLHHRSLLQSSSGSSNNGKVILPFYTTYIAVGLVVLVVVSIATFCFIRYYKDRKMLSTFEGSPASLDEVGAL